MIDFHAHLLPGLDDGVSTLDEALAVSRTLSEQGVEGVVVTPHVMAGGYSNSRERILDSVAELRRSLDLEGIPLRLYPGSEVYLSPEIPEWYARGDLVTVNDGGAYLLIELPYQEYPPDTPWVIDELLRLGVRTIIAHPERNGTLARRPELLSALVRRSALGQVNAGSLMGLYGRAEKRVARAFVRRRLVHLLGSDLHSGGRRSRLMSAAWEQFCALVPREERQLYSEELPELVLRGDDARCPLPTEPLLTRLAGVARRFGGFTPRIS
jgi:protein-tyrosine phosphatase